MQVKKYPLYMYHKDENEPLRVDNKDEERQLSEKGYVDHYIHKDYPKWVKGAIVKNKKEHEERLSTFPDVGDGEVNEEAKEDFTRRPGRPRRG